MGVLSKFSGVLRKLSDVLSKLKAVLSMLQGAWPWGRAVLYFHFASRKVDFCCDFVVWAKNVRRIVGYSQEIA